MSKLCWSCEKENEDSAECCPRCGEDLDHTLTCECGTKNPLSLDINYCPNCRKKLNKPYILYIKELYKIKQENKLTVSNPIGFKKYQVMTDLLDIRRTKNGSEIKKCSFNLRHIYNKNESKSEKILFLDLTKENIRKNEPLINEEMFKATYDPEIDKLHKGNESEKLLWYIFAKKYDKLYHFLGEFKIDIIDKNKNKIFYIRKSEILFLKEDRRDVIPSIKRNPETFKRGLAFSSSSANDKRNGKGENNEK